MGITLDNASNNSTFIHLLVTWSINLAVQYALSSCLDKEIVKVKI